MQDELAVHGLEGALVLHGKPVWYNILDIHMEKKTLEILFANKLFWIPDYQRDYAWTLNNIKDLFNDIRECIETKTPHYIGTFILSKVPLEAAKSIIDSLVDDSRPEGMALDSSGVFEGAAAKVHALVDGQQRLTSLSMIVQCLVEELPEGDEDRVVYQRWFLRSHSIPHLLLQTNNQEFYSRLVQNPGDAVPTTRGQRRLKKAYAEVKGGT